MTNATTDTDLVQACADLDRVGYCVVPDVIESDATAEIGERVLAQAAGERAAALDFEYPAEAEGDHVNQWVYQLLNKGEVFRTLPLHPVVRNLATHVLGADHLLSTIDSHITYPNNKAMPLHADQWWMPQPVAPGETQVRQGDINRTNGPTGGPEPAHHPITGPLILNVMWMITDFTVTNGATRVVPRSHLSGSVPAPGESYDEVQVVGSAGSILAWDGRTWHGSGLNTSDGPRIGVTTYFSGPMIRGLGNLVYGTPTDVREQLSDELLRLIGFEPWNSYGMTDDPNCQIVRHGDLTAGELP